MIHNGSDTQLRNYDGLFASWLWAVTGRSVIHYLVMTSFESAVGRGFYFAIAE